MEPTNYVRQAWPDLEALISGELRPAIEVTEAYRDMLRDMMTQIPTLPKFIATGDAYEPFLPGLREAHWGHVMAPAPFGSLIVENPAKRPTFTYYGRFGDELLIVPFSKTEKGIRRWIMHTAYGIVTNVGDAMTNLRLHTHATQRSPYTADEVRVIQSDLETRAAHLGLLNLALSCSNVSKEKIGARPLNKSAAKRGALPFDDYYVLMVEPRQANGESTGVGCTSRSPREHLRRGTICRNKFGTTWWRNASIVNAGVGGKIKKDYSVR